MTTQQPMAYVAGRYCPETAPAPKMRARAPHEAPVFVPGKIKRTSWSSETAFVGIDASGTLHAWNPDAELVFVGTAEPDTVRPAGVPVDISPRVLDDALVADLDDAPVGSLIYAETPQNLTTRATTASPVGYIVGRSAHAGRASVALLSYIEARLFVALADRAQEPE